MVLRLTREQLLGAAYMNETWSETMRSLDIEYYNSRFACFAPTTSKWVSQTVCGLQNYVTLDNKRDYEEFDPVFMGVNLLWSAKKLYADAGFQWLSTGTTKKTYNVDTLTGSDLVRTSIDAGLTPKEIQAKWAGGLKEFKKKREKYLMY
jgi:uncharacterized protein YbbC (DUF1343 family)